MEEEKRKFKRGNEWWIAVRHPGVYVGPIGPTPTAATEYPIEFYRLDKDGNPVPNEHPPVARTSKPFGDKVEFPDSELELLLNGQLEPD